MKEEAGTHFQEGLGGVCAVELHEEGLQLGDEVARQLQHRDKGLPPRRQVGHGSAGAHDARHT